MYCKQIFYNQACIIVYLLVDQGGAFQRTVMFLIVLVEFIEIGWFALSVRKPLPVGEIRSADLSRFNSDGEGDMLAFRVLELLIRLCTARVHSGTWFVSPPMYVH